MVNYVKGNLLDSECDYICHQVNCWGTMRSGIAKQIRERWPVVYEVYRANYERHDQIGIPATELLGDVDMVWVQDREGFVFNMYSQASYGYDGKRYTSYDAFVSCLEQIEARVPAGSSIGFPKNIGCGLGGGNWRVISALIEEILGKSYEVYIYELEDA